MEAWLERFARANFARSVDTAHDLKTPLNIAVLNLELLRMRLRNIGGQDDEKVLGYTRAIEFELRRMGQIFDEFFVMSTPPRGGEEPVAKVEIARIVREEAEAAGFSLPAPVEDAVVEAHEARIRYALKLFLEGASRILMPESRALRTERNDSMFVVRAEGLLRLGVESHKIFKFYYTDSEGKPDLSLAVARVIAETYGGELSAVEDRDKVAVHLSFLVGAR